MIAPETLGTQIVGRALRSYDQVGSTNDLARQNARAGEPEGLVLLAEEQVAGRGRLGRGWAAPPGSSLLMSLLLRPTWLMPADAFRLVMLAGLALCEAIEQVTPIAARLKWPNDLLLPDPLDRALLRKAAGILCELELADGQIEWVVIGMGINVNWQPAGLVDGRDLAQVATSIAAAAGQPVDRAALLRALLTRLDEGYLALRRGQHERLFAGWRDRLSTLGQTVTVRLPGGTLEGLAEDVTPAGALLLRDSSGQLHTILAGDVGS